MIARACAATQRPGRATCGGKPAGCRARGGVGCNSEAYCTEISDRSSSSAKADDPVRRELYFIQRPSKSRTLGLLDGPLSRAMTSRIKGPATARRSKQSKRPLGISPARPPRPQHATRGLLDATHTRRPAIHQKSFRTSRAAPPRAAAGGSARW
jgi:hypothetical protein